ncbi:hypothetical protein P43SY_003426 [Pythium insidiosum]|uniref:Myb-like DNA-binding protein n=1 Tax=Pythium insidiosum TaxID=114742 RepID=A0AAD5M2Y1_PYTIN|nr:hypothetical protein P43SY_003426 [Pythium insidiosum]KAJ0408337.1 hypothetical protein ATCC90586_000078 [Pythium insidiosum]
MTISASVRKELFEMTSAEGKLIRIKPTEAKAGTTVYSSKQSQPLKMWTQEEHEKFLEAMEKYPSGPWKVIAAFIGTKTTRQTMTHAQKYRQKISRWRRGLRHKGRKHNGDGAPGSGSDSEPCAKDNLFKAIEYVSGTDGSMQHSADRAMRPQVDGGNQLFRLAELASIEVMKNHHAPGSNSPNLEHSQENSGVVGNNNVPMTHPQWYGAPGSKEWPTQHTEIKLSPLRQAGEAQPQEISSTREGFPGMVTCSMQMSALGTTSECPEDDGANGSVRLPPLKSSVHGGNLSAIPPLRSKIDPSVLGRAQFATIN